MKDKLRENLIMLLPLTTENRQIHEAWLLDTEQQGHQFSNPREKKNKVSPTTAPANAGESF